MNTFSVVLAVGPLAIYCLVLGAIHFRRRPKVVSGNRDLACLGLAMVGMFLVGPAELFFPHAAFNLFGVSVWLALLMLYLFALLFAVLNTRFSVIVFGLDVDSLTTQLDQVLQSLDPGTKWLNQTFVAPSLGIQGVVEVAGYGPVSHAIATKREQNVSGWIALERALAKQLKTVESKPDASGPRWVALGIALLSMIGYTLISESAAIESGIRDMLRY